MGYGDLHAYNEVEAAFIIVFVFLNIVINAWIVGEFLFVLQPCECLEHSPYFERALEIVTRLRCPASR